MLKIKDITPEVATAFFRRDPTLCYLGLCDEALANLMADDHYILFKNQDLWGVFAGKGLIAVVKYEAFTYSTINMHIYLCSYMFHSGAFSKVQKALKAHIIKTTGVIKALVMCPATCPHIQKAAESYGFKKEGLISNCIVWRGELTDIIIYGIVINRSGDL